MNAGHDFYSGTRDHVATRGAIGKTGDADGSYKAAWKAHLGPPWKAYIEKTRHEDMERLKTAMH